MNIASPQRWEKLWHETLAVKPPSGSYEQLCERYAEPQRHYHNLRHISDCLDWFDRFASQADDPLAVELAIWFHDAVYDPRRSDNEERSADLAGDCLRAAKADTVLLDSVRQLVLATKSHNSSLHPDASLLVDVDLSILGQPEARFWKYEHQIRQEYIWVPAEVYCTKRAEILERFLARPRLFQTEELHHRFEASARENLQQSVRRLRAERIP